jgi:hypothetical protein
LLEAAAMRRGLPLLLCLLVLVPALGHATIRLTREQAKLEPLNNVPQERRGAYWAYPGNGGRITKQRLLGHGARGRDVVQGALNNCFFAGTASAAAAVKPEKIAALFPTLKNGRLQLDEQGRVAVRLHRRVRGELVAETYHVSAALPYRDGVPEFSFPASHKLWVPILEKAFAEMLARHGRIKGMNALNQGGTVRKVIEAITGEKATYRSIHPTAQGAERAWRFLSAATAQGEIVVAGTLGERALGPRKHKLITAGLLDGRSARITWDGSRMVGDHDQAVLGVFERDGQRYVRLRNPWGSYVPRGSGRRHGEYVLTLEKFMLFFDGVTHSGTVQIGDD